MSKNLNVYLGERLAGVLSDVGNARLTFQYNQEYINTSGLALSQSLPLTEKVFLDDQARPFFSGLLPDDQQLERLAQHLKVSKGNPFKLLAEVGQECAGAVSILPQETNDLGAKLISDKELGDEALLAVLNITSSRPMLGGDDSVRLSLAGAQSKLAVVIRDDKTYLSSPENPSTHILKPASSFVADLVENEYFCMQLAKRVGIDVPQTEIRNIEDTQVYQISRYDRRTANDTIYRIHQEDFRQALAIVPENKYEFEGGPGLQSCDELILKASARPALDRRQMLKRIVFDYLIGNNDAHAKNFSLLYQDNECRLAPAYDLVSTAIYSELNQSMAMKIGGRKNPADLQLRHWMRLVPDSKTSRTAFKDLVLDLCGQIESSLEDCTQNEALKNIGKNEVIKNISSLVIDRSSRLKGLFRATN